MNESRAATGARERWLVRLAYFGVLLLATLSRLEPVLDPAAVADRAGRVLEPGYSTALLVDAVRNVLLFAGWGLVWVATESADASRRGLQGAVVSGTAISVAVETLQLFSANRRASVLDILANAGGALLGALALVGAIALLSRRRGLKSFVGVPAVVFGGCYLMVILGEALMPLLRPDRLRVWGSPMNRLDHALEAWDPMTLSVLPVVDVVLFLPAGFLLVATFVEAGLSYRRAGLAAALTGTAAVVAAEIGHGMLSLPIETGAMLVHAGAIGAGAALGSRLLPVLAARLRGAERPRWLLLSYCLLVGLWFLRPYYPETDPGAWLEQVRSDWWHPLAFATYRMDLFTVVDVTNTFFLFFPLGSLLAVWPARASGWLAGVMPVVVLALVAEAAQIVVAGRTLAVADVVIAVAAAWAGHTVTRKAGFPVRGSLEAGAP